MIFLLIAAIEWLIISGIFALIASIKAHSPEFIESCEWFTYGRVQAIAHTAFIYGWACNAAFAIGIWLMLKLSGAKGCCVWITAVAGKFWNLGVFIGVVGILIGDMTTIEWLPIPGYAVPLLLVSSLAMCFWTFMTYFNREKDLSYISQWYILGAFLWFPLAIFGAQYMLFTDPVSGVVQSIGGWWYAASVYGLWLAPIALAAAYYFVPQVIGVKIFSYKSAKVAFWLWCFLVVFAGMRHLVGGPVPAWVQTSGVVASVMLLFPATLVCINLFFTSYGDGDIDKAIASPTVRFIFFGLFAFMMVTLLSAVAAIPEYSANIHFTYFEDGITQLALQGFIGLILFGSIYYIMPKLLDREWPCICLIKAHFWTTISGLFLVCATMFFAGWEQGYNSNQTAMSFGDITSGIVMPLRFYTGGVFLILLGQLAFAFNFYKILLGSCEGSKASDGPTIFPTAKSEYQ